MRAPLHRLSREATEWVEKAIQEDVAKGTSLPEGEVSRSRSSVVSSLAASITALQSVDAVVATILMERIMQAGFNPDEENVLSVRNKELKMGDWKFVR